MPDKLTFQLGNITFADFEVPEKLTDLGGRQVIALHEFPGGIRSAQLLGPLPKTIRWQGIMFGASAVSRALAMKQLPNNGEFLTLNYGEFSFDGIVTDFQIISKSRWEIEYECEFEPLDDNTGGGTLSSLPPTAADLLSQAAQTFSGQMSSPASGFQFPNVALAQASGLTSSIQSTLSQTAFNLGNASALQLSDLVSQIGSLRSVLSPIISAGDPQASSAASEADASLALMELYVSKQLPAIAVIPSQNPNLFALASIYYGNPGLWTYIGDANDLQDPMPLGDFNLVIPSLAGLPPAA